MDPSRTHARSNQRGEMTVAGAYCRFCNQRCFVLRMMPQDARWNPTQSVHLATCPKGMAYDREKTGYDQTTAINPMATV